MNCVRVNGILFKVFLLKFLSFSNTEYNFAIQKIIGWAELVNLAISNIQRNEKVAKNEVSFAWFH